MNKKIKKYNRWKIRNFFLKKIEDSVSLKILKKCSKKKYKETIKNFQKFFVFPVSNIQEKYDLRCMACNYIPHSSNFSTPSSKSIITNDFFDIILKERTNGRQFRINIESTSDPPPSCEILEPSENTKVGSKYASDPIFDTERIFKEIWKGKEHLKYEMHKEKNRKV